MRVAIIGATGQLGRELQLTAPKSYQITALNRQQLDLADPAAIAVKITALQPTVIINAAAYTAVDKAETEVELALLINTEAASQLAVAALQIAARLIHVSTDFVFDGKKSSPYLPEDIANPQSSYGRSKWLGEQQVLAILPSALIIRTSWLYSSYGNNFVKTILRLLQEREHLKIVADQMGTPTSARTLAQAIWAALAQPSLSGIYHWSDAGVASWYDFAVAIQEEALLLGLTAQPKPIYPINTTDFPTPAKRPAYSVLDKTRSWQDFKMPATHWRKTLRTMLAEYVNYAINSAKIV
jgi:dTDP-4-dehydrorhamnose reductase